MLATVAAHASAAPLAQFQFGSVRSLTAGPDGRVWFFAKALDARGYSLYAANSSGVIKRVALPGFKVGVARAGTIGVGGDQRLWVAATGISKKGRTTIYRISRRGKVTSFVLPAKRRATALAGDSSGRTWLIGYSSTRVGFVDRRRAIHSFPVDNAKSLEDVALGPDNRIWASASASVTRISAREKPRTFAAGELPTANIASGGGYLWLPGVGSVQRVSTDGIVQKIPLQFPTFTPPFSTHVDYPFAPNRSSYALFTQPGAAVGFTAGTSTIDNTVGLGTDFTSTGTIDANAAAHESSPSQVGPRWYPSVTTGEFRSRRRGSKLAVVDGAGNQWLAVDSGVIVLPPAVL
ncbi:MAG: hypothetical protein WAO61_01520 [Solirubrobacterales bacterium]